MNLDIVRNNEALSQFFKFEILNVCKKRERFLQNHLQESILDEDVGYLSALLTLFAGQGIEFKRRWTVTPMVTYIQLSQEGSLKLLEFAEFALFRIGFFWLNLGKHETLRKGFIEYGRQAYIDMSKREEFNVPQRQIFRTSGLNFVAYAHIISEIEESTKKLDVETLLALYREYKTPGAVTALIKRGVPLELLD